MGKFRNLPKCGYFAITVSGIRKAILMTRGKSSILNYAVAVVAKLPGVVSVDERPSAHPDTLVLWAEEPDKVREEIRKLVRQAEIETWREEGES